MQALHCCPSTSFAQGFAKALYTSFASFAQVRPSSLFKALLTFRLYCCVFVYKIFLVDQSESKTDSYLHSQELDRLGKEAQLRNSRKSTSLAIGVYRRWALRRQQYEFVKSVRDCS